MTKLEMIAERRFKEVIAMLSERYEVQHLPGCLHRFDCLRLNQCQSNACPRGRMMLQQGKK